MTWPIVVVGLIVPAVLPRQAGEDHPGEQRVERHAREDDHHPLPDRLGLEDTIGRDIGGAVSFEHRGSGILLARRHLHVAAQRQPGDGPLGLAAVELEPRNRLADSDGEAMDPDAEQLGGEKVPQLVDEHQHAEHHGQDGDGKQKIAHAIASPAERRDAESAARTASTESAAVDMWRDSACSITSLIRPNGIRDSQECRHGLLVGGIERGRGRSPGPPRRHAELEGGKAVAAHRLERQGSGDHRIEAAHTGVGHPDRVSQGVQDRSLHGRESHLGEDTSVGKFHHGVDDALGMDNHFDGIVRKAEEKVRLDHFERLVGQRRGIHRHLRPHAPRRVIERLRHGGGLQPMLWPGPERPARGRENQARWRRPLRDDAL